MTVRQHDWTLALLATLASANKWSTAMEQVRRKWWHGKCKPQDDTKMIHDLFSIGGI